MGASVEGLALEVAREPVLEGVQVRGPRLVSERAQVRVRVRAQVRGLGLVSEQAQVRARAQVRRQGSALEGVLAPALVSEAGLTPSSRGDAPDAGQSPASDSSRTPSAEGETRPHLRRPSLRVRMAADRAFSGQGPMGIQAMRNPDRIAEERRPGPHPCPRLCLQISPTNLRQTTASGRALVGEASERVTLR
jgi:hypothetical protein